jgi:serine/threonine protein kinase
MVHGNLSSKVCLVDSRWTLKVSGFDIQLLPPLNLNAEDAEHSNDLLWTAPEILRSTNALSKKTKSTDVYSFGIILQEILCREEPFFVGTCPFSAKGRSLRTLDVNPFIDCWNHVLQRFWSA